MWIQKKIVTDDELEGNILFRGESRSEENWNWLQFILFSKETF